MLVCKVCVSVSWHNIHICGCLLIQTITNICTLPVKGCEDNSLRPWTCSIKPCMNHFLFCRFGHSLWNLFCSIVIYIISCIQNRSVRDKLVKVVDFKQLVLHRCGFESRQGLWIQNTGLMMQDSNCLSKNTIEFFDMRAQVTKKLFK
jgi:hypothetical protein